MINNANAILFDLCTRLKDNGVVAKASGNYEFSEDKTSLDFVERISELDFTEHDKRFRAEIKQLKHELSDVQKSADEYYNKYIDLTNQIEKLKSELEAKVNFGTDRLVKLSFDALETANMLINAEYSRQTSSAEKAFTGCNVAKGHIYSVDDLEQIAEHLLVYCKHNKESEE